MRTRRRRTRSRRGEEEERCRSRIGENGIGEERKRRVGRLVEERGRSGGKEERRTMTKALITCN